MLNQGAPARLRPRARAHDLVTLRRARKDSELAEGAAGAAGAPLAVAVRTGMAELGVAAGAELASDLAARA